jgi:hypothetical protein
LKLIKGVIPLSELLNLLLVPLRMALWTPKELLILMAVERSKGFGTLKEQMRLKAVVIHLAVVIHWAPVIHWELGRPKGWYLVAVIYLA